jgi:hypothetical protein
VGRPASVFLVVVIVGRRSAAPTSAVPEIVGVIVAIGKAEGFVHFVTARHYRLL